MPLTAKLGRHLIWACVFPAPSSSTLCLLLTTAIQQLYYASSAVATKMRLYLEPVQLLHFCSKRQAQGQGNAACGRSCLLFCICLSLQACLLFCLCLSLQACLNVMESCLPLQQGMMLASTPWNCACLTGRPVLCSGQFASCWFVSVCMIQPWHTSDACRC